MKIAFDAKRAFHNHRGLGNYSRDTIRLLGQFYPENEYLLYNPSQKNKIGFLPDGNFTEINPTSVVGKLLPSLWRSSGMHYGQKFTNIIRPLRKWTLTENFFPSCQINTPILHISRISATSSIHTNSRSYPAAHFRQTLTVEKYA